MDEMTRPVAPSTDDLLRTLHPDCPDWERLGPTRRDAAVRAAAVAAEVADEERTSAWAGGFNRRAFLKGGLGVGVATLGAQLVTTRVSYSAEAASTTTSNGTLVVIFLRGGMDGLSMLVPVADPMLARARPTIAVRARSAMEFDAKRGFGLHPALAPLAPLITAGKVAAVPAVSTPDLSRSHFQAQDCLERGSSTTLTSGWLDRVLAASGPGTTFRSVAVGGNTPRSLIGTSNSMAMYDLDSIQLYVDPSEKSRTTRALEKLYTGVHHPIATQTRLAVGALATVDGIRKAQPAKPAVTYPEGNFADALQSLAALIKGRAGVRVACVDVGGWDTHTGMGTVDSGDMMRHLGDLAAALAAFTTDIGSAALEKTTIVTMSEFGRRIEENASGGTDHGHGGAVLVIGGGVNGGVHGAWHGLSGHLTVEGDVPGWNDYRDVLSEVVMKRVGLSAGKIPSVFPGWKPKKVGVMR